jgi:hypothetical protein
MAAAAMAPAGCGNLSLTGVLSNESPGEFRLSPETVNLQVGGQFTFSATGGFLPYNYQVVSGLGTLKDQTWVYQAPDDIGTDPYIEVTIKATDQLGDSDTATARVFNPFSITPNGAVTIQLGGSVTIQAAGGVIPYTWAFDDGTANPSANPFNYAPLTAGTHVVSITDALGNYKELAITVLPASAPLTIDPVSAGVQVNGTVTFTAFGGTPPYTWSATTGTMTGTGSTATYTATAGDKDTVKLADSTGTSVTATVTVTAAPIQPLVLSPEGPRVTAVGDRVQFSAAGGVPPYTFSSAPQGYINSNGLYTQKDSRKKVNVFVRDTMDASDVTTVYYGR